MHTTTHPEITVTGGRTSWVQVKSPRRGILVSAALVQREGDKEGFSWALFDSSLATPPTNGEKEEEKQRYVPEDRDTYIEHKHRITSQCVVPAGENIGHAADLPCAFANRDPGTGATVKNPYIYLELTVPGTGPKVFGLFLEHEPPNL